MRQLSGGFSLDFPGYDAAQLFHLAVDVESYPDFIPGCTGARVRRRDGDRLLVDNRFGAGPLGLEFTSVAVQEPPHRLTITAADGPFRAFRLEWRFEPLAGGGCRVAADYSMELQSPLLAGLARMAMPEMERRVAERFRQRAKRLYG